ncbi:MAG: radical SAM protein [Myxococcota bacterium]
MTIEVLPLGVQCNLRCQYCYQNQERDSGHTHLAYDLDAMKAALAAEGGEFTIFGGEALLMPKADLEDLWAWGFERYGHNGVQTNGSLIDDDHIRMFRDYNVSVGVSVDGPGELNDARWVGSLQTTREATAKTQANIERLCAEGMAPSLIITLTRANASADKLPRMSAWLRDLDRRGVPAARLHTLEVETAEIGEHYALTVEETVAAMRRLSALEQQLSMKFDLFGDIEQLQLLNDDAMTCTFAACDPYTTSAVQGVGPRGQRSNCGRAHKEGVDHVKAGTPGFERYLALHNTPQARGGCSGCRFFAMCKGQCPGTAVSGDWRQRTSECSLWKELFRASETSLLSRGVLPLSLRPERKAIEAALLQAWAQGENPTLESIARTLGFAPIAVDLKREQARRAGEPTEVPSDPVPLPDFVRMSWASDTARELWQGRLEQIQRMRIDVALHQAAVQSICRPLLLLPAELMGLRSPPASANSGSRSVTSG